MQIDLGFGISMYSHYQIILMIIGVFTAFVLYPSLISPAFGVDTSFDEHFAITYGSDHVKFLDQKRTQVQLSLDSKSGAGFGSKLKYGSGYFNMLIKLPPHDSAGVVTAFYLRSEDKNFDEIDFEFLGNRPGKKITIQTNIFANGVGNREQRMVLPIDPTDDYHSYKILWNSHMIMMLVDGIPIRIFKNNTGMGVGYPSKPMRILASVWDGDSWATDGGRTKIDWSHAPFSAQFTSFGVNGCSSTRPHACDSSNYWWNQKKYWYLNEGGKFWYEAMRVLLTYDYCTDTKRYPVPPPECATNSFL